MHVTQRVALSLPRRVQASEPGTRLIKHKHPSQRMLTRTTAIAASQDSNALTVERSKPAGAFVLFMLLALVNPGCRNDRTDQVATEASSVDQKADDRERLQEIESLLDRGDTASAYAKVQRILVQNPDHIEAIGLSARILVARNDPKQAVAILEDAASRIPEHEFSLLRQAVKVLESQDAIVHGTDLLQRLAILRPANPEILRLAAEALNRRGYRFDANEHLRALARIAPLNPRELRSLLTPSGSYLAVPETLDLNSAAVIESPLVMNLVRGLYGKDELRKSRSLLENTPAFQQRLPVAMALHGLLLLESQNYADLSRWFSESERAWQRYPDYWLAVGGLALHQREFALAVGAFANSISREPCSKTAIHRMTQALEALGDVHATDFRERGKDIQGLDELTGDMLRYPNIASSAFQIVSRELKRIGEEFEAFSWRLLDHQRQVFAGGEIQDDINSRQQLLESVDAKESLSKRLCGLDLDRYASDFSSLKELSATSSPIVLQHAPVTPEFTNVAAEVKLDFRYQNADPPVERYFLLHQALGAGIACLDYDLDGKVDVYVAQGAGNPSANAAGKANAKGQLPNVLARNLGTDFSKVTSAANCDDRRYSIGLTAGDWNQDGFPDLVVGNMNANQLLINQGDGTFRRQQGDLEWLKPKYTTGLAIADITGDHLPDIVEVNYTDDDKIFDPIEFMPNGSPVRLPGPIQFAASTDRLFTSIGDGSLKGEPLASDPSMRRYAMGLIVTDLDTDGHNDIFVGNDQTANQWWKAASGEGTTRVREAAVISGLAYGKGGAPNACMGIAAADFDLNGLMDLHITNFDDEWSNQYMQLSAGVFTDLALPFGLDVVSNGMLGFGTQAIDYDNDSIPDIVIGNGHIEDFRSRGTPFHMPTQVLAGTGGSFESMEVKGDPSYWQQGHLSRSLIAIDWNGDGRMDFAVTDLMKPLALMENRTPSANHWLQLQLVGTESERDAIGARVRIRMDDQPRVGVVQTGDGYMGKNQAIVHFGLGDSAKIDELEIRWPSGATQRWNNLDSDQRLMIVEGDRDAYSLSPPVQSSRP